jgi:hypothetical protein
VFVFKALLSESTHKNTPDDGTATDFSSYFTNKTLPVILDGTFFEICSIEGNLVAADCQFCSENRKVRGATTATSNFVSHLRV